MTNNDIKWCLTAKKSKVWRTDGPTDRQTDRVGHRVACTRLKISFWKASCFKTTGQEADWLHLLKSFAYCRYCLLLIKILSHVACMNLLYSIINLDSWRCPVLKYLSVSCLVLVGGHCLSTNLTHSKGMFMTFHFNICYHRIGFLGGQE